MSYEKRNHTRSYFNGNGFNSNLYSRIDMKTKIKDAQYLMNRAEQLLNASGDMLSRAEHLRDFHSQYLLFGNFKRATKLMNDIDTCERGAKRLYQSYLNTLTKIQEL